MQNVCFEMFIDYQYLDPVESNFTFTPHYYGSSRFPRNRSYADELSVKFFNMADRASDHHYTYARAIQRHRMEIKQRLEKQLSDNRTYRFARIWRQSIPAIRRLFAAIGEQHPLREDHDLTTLIELLDEVTSRFGAAYARRIVEKTSLELAYCQGCDTWHDPDEMHSVYRRPDVCEACLDDYYYSECMDQYLHPDDRCSVYDSAQAFHDRCPDDYCTWEYGSRNFSEYDGSFFSDEDAYYEIRDYYSEDDYDYEEEESSCESRYFRGYHSASRDFTEINASQAYPALGLELEVYAYDRREAVDDLGDEFHEQFIFERDGSLNGECGFEMVSKPFGREEWIDLVPRFTKMLHDLEVVGFNEPAGSGYGIHVTIHRRHFSPLAEARVAMFLASEENAQFVKAIAQRDSIYGPGNGFNMGSIDKYAKLNTVSYCVEHNYALNQKKISGKGKYCPVNWKESLAEFRIFQSTTNPSSIMKNFEFVWALHAWTKDTTGSRFNHRDFVAWLNTPARRKEFPFLYAFLSKKTFYGTNYSPITSTWQDLFTKPSEQEAVEPVFA